MWPFSKAIDTNEEVRDMLQVLQIERENFACPWDVVDFAKHLQHGYVQCVRNITAGIVVGYLCVSPRKHSWHIDTISVRSDYQRRRLATGLIDNFLARLKPNERRLTAHVSDKNLHAQLFLRSLGFKATKIVRGYFDDGSDAYLFSFYKKPEQGECGGKHEVKAIQEWPDEWH
jgi:ribosomal-protein-alanine N-acetyltransferase